MFIGVTFFNGAIFFMHKGSNMFTSSSCRPCRPYRPYTKVSKQFILHCFEYSNLHVLCVHVVEYICIKMYTSTIKENTNGCDEANNESKNLMHGKKRSFLLCFHIDKETNTYTKCSSTEM